MAVPANHYDVLGVSESAPLENIRAAYQRMLLIHHPDKSSSNSSQVERIMAIQQAWKCLKDADDRLQFDRVLAGVWGAFS